jgi:ketosteroid isomerase-like protein
MSTENVELVRRCYELWHSRDWTALPEVCDPEVEVDLSRNVFNPGVYRGYAGMERWVAAVDEIWSEFRVVPTDFVHTADKVVTEVMVHGKGKGSGVDVEMRLFNV